MAKLFTKSGDSDLDLHCLPITLLRVSRRQWVNVTFNHLSVISLGIWQGLQCSLSVLSTLGKNFGGLHFEIFFLYFSQKMGFDLYCKLSPNEIICI